MQQRIQNDYVLNQLVASFEAQEDGLNAYFDDKELLQLIKFYQDEYNYDKALIVTQLGLDQYIYTTEFIVAKARILGLMEEYEEMLTTIEDGMEMAPGELELIVLQIYAKTQLGQIDEAKATIKKQLAQAKGEDRVQLLVCKGHIHEKEKDFEAMFNSLKKALIIDPNEMQALEKIWISVEICKNFKESILLHNYIIDRNPYNYHAWYNLGHAYACLGEYPDSIMSLEYSFLIEPNFEIGYKDCAEMCFQVGRFKQALSIYLDALKQFGVDMELLVSIGRCYLELNDPLEAKRYLTQACVIDPYDDESHYYLGKSHFVLGDYANAIPCFAEAIKLEDRREEYHADIAKSYHLTGEYTLANYYFNKATEAGPEEMQYWFHHMVFLFDIGAIEAVVDVLEEAEIHTYGPEIVYIKAALAFHSKQRKNGITLLSEAIEEEPDALDSFYTLYPNYQNEEDIVSLIEYLVKK